MEPYSTDGVAVETCIDSFRDAKIEHFLDRAEEFHRMSRFKSAMTALNRVFELDSVNPSALVLKKKIENSIDEVARLPLPTSNGHSASAKRGQLVVVADQDGRVLEALSSSLHRYGFASIGAASFNEAIESLTLYRPSLIISEVNFENGPVGFDLFFWIRNNSRLRDVPFLFLATKVTREMLVAGKRLGVDEFIEKPLDEEIVMASILNCLARTKKSA
jgi:PleD family two-component response regulator